MKFEEMLQPAHLIEERGEQLAQQPHPIQNSEPNHEHSKGHLFGISLVLELSMSFQPHCNVSWIDKCRTHLLVHTWRSTPNKQGAHFDVSIFNSMLDYLLQALDKNLNQLGAPAVQQVYNPLITVSA